MNIVNSPYASAPPEQMSKIKDIETVLWILIASNVFQIIVLLCVLHFMK
jgi:hypothetical protein